MEDLKEAMEQAAEDAPPQSDKMVLIAASGDLDKAWPVMILATTGAAYGMDVTIFFTFWGLSILKRHDSGITGDDWRQKMLSVFHPGSPNKLGLSKLHFAGMGPKMMKGLADDKNVASVQELLDAGSGHGREAVAMSDDDGPHGNHQRRHDRRPSRRPSAPARRSAS